MTETSNRKFSVDEIAGREREFAGRLLFHRDGDDGAVGLRAVGVSSTVDVLEEAQRADAAARAVEQHAVEGVAFADAHLAADDAVERAGVADDVDALDEDARALVHFERDVDDAVFAIALDVRA